MLCYAFAALACTLSLLPSSSLQMPNPAEDSILRNATVEKSFGVTASDVACSIRFGQFIPKEADSCRNALEKISQDPTTHTYIRRHRGARPTTSQYIPLPIRYLSDDGICAIDVLLDPTASDEDSSSRVFYQKANQIIDECLIRLRRGGIIKRFTPHHSLHISVSRYEPTVDCEPRPQAVPSYENCEDVLQWMPTTVKRYWFTTPDPMPEPPVRTYVYLLPRDFVSSYSPRPCHVFVDMPLHLPRTEARWFDLWAAGVAVNTMCVQHGMDGKAILLGDNDQITVSVGLRGNNEGISVAR